MGLKPFSNISHQQPVVFSEEQFIEDIFNDEYVLVVGSEVIMSHDVEPSGDVNKYILSIVNESLHTRYKDFNELVANTNQGVDPIRNLLKDNESSYNIEDISPELRSLLSTKLFPVVLTTTFDGYLETLMREIWGDRLRVVNIDDMRSLNDLRDAIKECRFGKKYQEPTLLYIFGKAVDKEMRTYVRTDDDAIRIIEKWMQLPKDDIMLSFIKDKKLLALGCRYDDWYFRFFWYILKREISKFREGQVAFMLDADNQFDMRLKAFLEHSRIFHHQDARKFMSDVTTWLTDLEEGSILDKTINRKRKSGSIFLSYCSEDFILASQIFFKLSDMGYNVWFDNFKLRGGDNYNIKISEAIASSNIFIPVLSPSIREDFLKGTLENRYYPSEWKRARQLGNKTVIPLAIDGYNLRASYHEPNFGRYFNNLTGINLMKERGFEELRNKLDEAL